MQLLKVLMQKTKQQQQQNTAPFRYTWSMAESALEHSPPQFSTLTKGDTKLQLSMHIYIYSLDEISYGINSGIQLKKNKKNPS